MNKLRKSISVDTGKSWWNTAVYSNCRITGLLELCWWRISKLFIWSGVTCVILTLIGFFNSCVNVQWWYSAVCMWYSKYASSIWVLGKWVLSIFVCSFLTNTSPFSSPPSGRRQNYNINSVPQQHGAARANNSWRSLQNKPTPCVCHMKSEILCVVQVKKA